MAGPLAETPLRLKFLYLVLLFVCCLVLTSALTLVISLGMGYNIAELMHARPEAFSTDRNGLAFLKGMQILYSIGAFVAPALLGAWLFYRKPLTILGLDGKPSWSWVVMAFLILISATFFLEWITRWNAGFTLPESLKSLEDTLRGMEDQAAALTALFLDMPDFQAFLGTFLMVAVLPAIGEELLFRGLLQRMLQGVFKNPHVGIWVAAILFSALHGQFYGFFPRLFLGALFGYLFFWSGSLWVAIVAHFLNNGLAVIASYVMDSNITEMELEGAGPLTGVISLALTLWLMVYYRGHVIKHRHRKALL